MAKTTRKKKATRKRSMQLLQMKTLGDPDRKAALSAKTIVSIADENVPVEILSRRNPWWIDLAQTGNPREGLSRLKGRGLRLSGEEVRKLVEFLMVRNLLDLSEGGEVIFADDTRPGADDNHPAGPRDPSELTDALRATIHKQVTLQSALEEAHEKRAIAEDKAWRIRNEHWDGL
jgi:hypothetical protein